jgi:hypothetical protein
MAALVADQTQARPALTTRADEGSESLGALPFLHDLLEQAAAGHQIP